MMMMMMMIIIIIIIIILSLWRRVLLDKLTRFKLVMNFPAFYGTRRFVTAFTSGRHLSLCRATLIQSILSHPTS